MATLFYDSFQNTNNWIGRNGGSTSINVISDPKNQYNMVAYLANNPVVPDTFSTIISNNYKSFTISFDYLGLPKSASIAVNLGCILSISDGGSLTDVTIAYAGSVKNSVPPTCSDKFIGPSDWVDQCYHNGALYYKYPSFISLSDDSNWHHYSITFSTNNQNIRLALNDFGYSNYPESNTAGDCYFTNLLVTDSYGPSPFVSTSSPENFRSIAVDVLNQVANTVSYVNSNAAVNINLASNSASGGYAEGDILNDIVNIIGSNYNDVILGNNEDNKLTGGTGNDVLTAGIGNDILIGGSGSDKFIITTDITTATISDFDISNDVVDLRLFNNFNSLQSIKNIAQYSNGNTVISLGGSKSLILNGINYNDLQETDFIITTLSPTQVPTAVPSPLPTSVPTFLPTAAPSSSPTQTPTAPTSTPTTSSPTYNPTTHPTAIPTAIPTQSPSFPPTAIPSQTPTNAPTTHPTATPTAIPTQSPSFPPTATPSQTPTNAPTSLPTALPTSAPTGLYSTTIDVTIGNSRPGTSASENFKIDSPLAVSITGNGGLDKFTISPHAEVTYTITDFDVKDDRIDLQLCNVYKKSELIITTNPAGFVLITLPDNNQQLKLLNLQADDIAFGNFIFTPTSSPTLVPTLEPTYNPTLTSTSSFITDNTLIAAAVGTVVGATLLVGSTFLYKNCYPAHQTAPEVTPNNLGVEANKMPYNSLDDSQLVAIGQMELVGDASHYSEA